MGSNTIETSSYKYMLIIVYVKYMTYPSNKVKVKSVYLFLYLSMCTITCMYVWRVTIAAVRCFLLQEEDSKFQKYYGLILGNDSFKSRLCNFFYLFVISSRRVPSTFLELLMPVEYFSELGGLYTAYIFFISKLN